jgi:hypothetical protein
MAGLDPIGAKIRLVLGWIVGFGFVGVRGGFAKFGGRGW